MFALFRQRGCIRTIGPFPLLASDKQLLDVRRWRYFEIAWHPVLFTINSAFPALSYTVQLPTDQDHFHQPWQQSPPRIHTRPHSKAGKTFLHYPSELVRFSERHCLCLDMSFHVPFVFWFFSIGRCMVFAVHNSCCATTRHQMHKAFNRSGYIKHDIDSLISLNLFLSPIFRFMQGLQLDIDTVKCMAIVEEMLPKTSQDQPGVESEISSYGSQSTINPWNSHPTPKQSKR